MTNFDYLIGSPLKGISMIGDQELEGEELCLDQVQLFFENTVITLQPLADTDEIEITLQPDKPIKRFGESPEWGSDLIGKTLETVWTCHNTQHYQDQLIFAFDSLQPTLVFLAEGSVLKVFRCEQVMKSVVKPSEAWSVEHLTPAMFVREK
jgi:hypothetical protein